MSEAKEYLSCYDNISVVGDGDSLRASFSDREGPIGVGRTDAEAIADLAHDLDRQFTERTRERDDLRQWVNDLQSGMYVNCVYCGHRYGPQDQVPCTMADVLKEHIEQCPKHPLKKLSDEYDSYLRNQCLALGYSNDEVDAPPEHGNARLRWAAMAAVRIIDIRTQASARDARVLREAADALEHDGDHVAAAKVQLMVDAKAAFVEMQTPEHRRHFDQLKAKLDAIRADEEADHAD